MPLFSIVTLRKTKAYTMPIQPGEFWVADIPFTSGSGSKKRPLLVLWLDGLDAVVAAVTSAAPRSPTDVPLTGRDSCSFSIGRNIFVRAAHAAQRSKRLPQETAYSAALRARLRSSNDSCPRARVTQSAALSRFGSG